MIGLPVVCSVFNLGAWIFWCINIVQAREKNIPVGGALLFAVYQCFRGLYLAVLEQRVRSRNRPNTRAWLWKRRKLSVGHRLRDISVHPSAVLFREQKLRSSRLFAEQPRRIVISALNSRHVTMGK